MAGAVRRRICTFAQVWRGFSAAVLIADGGKNGAIEDAPGRVCPRGPRGRELSRLSCSPPNGSRNNERPRSRFSAASVGRP